MTRPINPIQLRSVLLWGLINLGLLGVGASGLSLWAHHPAPKESISFYVLVCGQVIFTGLVFPKLATNFWTLGVNLLLLLPFGELTGFMSNLSQIQILRGIGCVGLWIGGLGWWKCLVSEPKHLILVALASLFSSGGAMLDYLRWEAVANSGDPVRFHAISLLPKLVQNTQYGEAGCWMEAGIPLLLAIFWRVSRRVTPQSTTKFPVA